jgi:arylsulfatase A-like enzyme
MAVMGVGFAHAQQGLESDDAVALNRPNILMIAVDDLKPMLGCYGDEEILTPHLDQLAERGTVFLNNACQQSVCAPSRVSLMTGTYPDTTKVYDLKTQMREANPQTLTLPEYLVEQGYETTGTGKIYDPRTVDKQYDAASWSQPFRQYKVDAFFAEGHPQPKGGYHDLEVGKQKKAMKAYMKKNAIEPSQLNAYQQLLVRFPMVKPLTECLDLPDDAYEDGAFAKSAIQQMEVLAKGDKPFFLAVGFKKPHLPFVAPKKYWDLYDRSTIQLAEFQQMPKGAPDFAFQDSWELRGSYSNVKPGPIPADQQREMIHGYRACVSYIDAQVGLVLSKLKELGLEKNTIIVFWGDHGFHLGDHGMFCKHSNYEQAVRAPLIFAAPSQTMKGMTTESPSEFVDIFPTLCELAGIPIPTRVEGTSLVPILHNPNAIVRESAMEQYPRKNMMGYTLRDKRYRYIKWVKKNTQGEGYGAAVATELYDYAADPLETVNQAANPEYAAVVEKFEVQFRERKVAQEEW